MFNMHWVHLSKSQTALVTSYDSLSRMGQHTPKLTHPQTAPKWVVESDLSPRVTVYTVENGIEHDGKRQNRVILTKFICVRLCVSGITTWISNVMCSVHTKYVQSTHIRMIHFTEYLNFSERPNAGEQRLEDTWDLLQGCPAARARVRHSPMKKHEHEEQLKISIILIGNQKGDSKTLANPASLRLSQ